MTIEVYGDVILPKNVVLAGVGGRQTRQNTRGNNPAGFATVNAIRDVTLREYTIGIKSMKLALWNQIEAIWEITDAGTFGFLIEDPKGPTVSNGVLQGYMAGVEYGAPGFGNGTARYGLRQTFKAASSTRIRTRAVTRTGSAPVVKRGGSTVVVGGGAGNISLSAAPVYITFVPDATRAVSSIATGATTVVTLASAIPIIVNGRLWLEGITGSAAALLNNLSHQVLTVAGAVYTIAANTTGTAAVTGTAQAHKYPQPDEALTWAGTYYVPVQFAEDSIDWTLTRPGNEDDRLFSGPSIPLVEVREA